MTTELKERNVVSSKPSTNSSENKRAMSVIRSLDDLGSVKRIWESLLSDEAPPFQTFSWNRAWFRNYEEEYDEIIVIVSSTRRAIFPLYRQGNTLRLAGDQMSDYQDVIAADPVDAKFAYEELLNWCQDYRFDLQFSRLATRGVLYSLIKKAAPGALWFQPVEKVIGPCPTFAVAGSEEETLSHLPRKFRAEMRRQSRRVETDFPGLEFKVTSPPENESEQFHDMVAFHREQFSREGINPMEDERFVRLLNEVKNDPKVGLRLARISNDETILAEDFTFIRGRRFYGFLMCFNRDYARYSPGTLLLKNRLNLLIEAGIDTFDFLCGPEAYKYRFATDEYFVRFVYLFPRTMRGAIGWARLKGNHLARNVAKMLLTKVGQRDRV